MATTYETRTQTRTDRYGGYSQYGTRYDEEESVNTYQPQTFVDFDDDNDSNTAFEVQKNYSFDTDETIVQSETARTMAMPDVIRKTRVIETPHTENKIKIRARGKIAITVYSIIVVALIAFAIYNAVAIKNLQAGVAYKNQAYIEQTIDINALIAEYNRLGSEERIIEDTNGIFIEPTESDIVRVAKTQMETRKTREVESNWFEELCQFLSGLFS